MSGNRCMCRVDPSDYLGHLLRDGQRPSQVACAAEFCILVVKSVVSPVVCVRGRDADPCAFWRDPEMARGRTPGREKEAHTFASTLGTYTGGGCCFAYLRSGGVCDNVGDVIAVGRKEAIPPSPKEGGGVFFVS